MTGRIIQGTILGIVLAAVFNFLLYQYGASRGVSYLVKQSGAAPQAVSLGMIIGLGSLMIIIAGLVLWLLSRVSDNPLMVFLWIAAIVAIISLIFPYQRALGMGSFATLGLIQIITAGAATLGLAIFFQRCPDCNN